MDQIFSKYKTFSPTKNIDLSTITFDNHTNKFLLRDFLLDNMEEESATRNEMRIHQIKPKNPLNEEKSTIRLVNYDEEEEEINKSK